MDDRQHQATAGFTRREAPLTAKQRGSVKHAVDRLLDELAPERAAARIERTPVSALQRHRSPRGCILQAPTGAVSVSWFPDSANDVAFGELQIVVWRGTVSRPGSANRSEGGAAVEREMVLRPIERGPDSWEWHATDGTVFDTDGLAAHCLAMLDTQVGGDAAAELPGGGSRAPA